MNKDNENKSNNLILLDVKSVEEIFNKGKAWIESIETLNEDKQHINILRFAGFLQRNGVDKTNAVKYIQKYANDKDNTMEVGKYVGYVYEYGTAGSRKRYVNHYAAADYIKFPLKMLWGPLEQTGSRIDKILSEPIVWNNGDIPTSLKIDYLIDARDGKLDFKHLLLVAAVKSILGEKNFHSTTNLYVYKRMMGDCPWRELTRYWIDKLFKEAMRKNLLSKVSGGPGFKGYYVSIKYRPVELGNQVIKGLRAKKILDDRPKKATDQICNYRKSIRKKKPVDPLKKYPFGSSDEQQSFDKPLSKVSAP